MLDSRRSVSKMWVTGYVLLYLQIGKLPGLDPNLGLLLTASLC